MQHTRTFTPATSGMRSRAIPHQGAKHVSPYARLAKKIFKRAKVQLLVYSLLFYIAPAILSSHETLLLTLIYPAFCFLLSSIYGYKYGFIKHYLAIPFVMFSIASIFHFQAFSFLYGLCYLLVSIIALAFGTIYRQMAR